MLFKHVCRKLFVDIITKLLKNDVYIIQAHTTLSRTITQQRAQTQTIRNQAIRNKAKNRFCMRNFMQIQPFYI